MLLFAALLFTATLLPTTSSSAAIVPTTCKLEANAVSEVLGVSTADKWAGPELLAGGSCSWKTTDPNCFLRVLSVRERVTGSDLAVVQDLLARAKPSDRAPKVLGRDAFFAHTDLGPGAAVSIERIYLPRGAKRWVEVAISGRLGPDGARGLLITAARSVPRLPAS